MSITIQKIYNPLIKRIRRIIMAIKRDLFLAILLLAITSIAGVIISIIKTQWKLIHDPGSSITIYVFCIIFLLIIIYLATRGMKIIDSNEDREKSNQEAKMNAIIDYLHIPPEQIAEKERELLAKHRNNQTLHKRNR